MELRHLRYFVAAAEDLNISRAARRLHVSQPAVSRLIRDLESELGTALFARERFGLRLTADGERMLDYARRILALGEEAVAAVGKAPRGGTLHVGFLSSSLGSFLGDGLRRFRQRHPEIQVEIHEMSPADQAHSLKKGAIDLALLGNPCEEILEGFETRHLFDLELQAVLPDRHPLARRQVLALPELAESDFVGYREESFPGRDQTIVNACRQAGFEPRLRYRVDSLMEALAMIASGAGVCLMPADVATLPHPHVAFVPVQEALEPIRFTAAWSRGDERPLLRQFLEILAKSANSRRG